MPSVKPVAEFDLALLSRERAAPRLPESADFARLLAEDAPAREIVPLRPVEPRPVRRETARPDAPPSREVPRTDRAEKSAGEEAPEAPSPPSDRAAPKSSKPSQASPNDTQSDAADVPPSDKQIAAESRTAEEAASFDGDDNGGHEGQGQKRPGDIEPSPDDESAAQANANALVNLVLAAPLRAPPAASHAAALPAVVAALQPMANFRGANAEPPPHPAAAATIAASAQATQGSSPSPAEDPHGAQPVSPVRDIAGASSPALSTRSAMASSEQARNAPALPAQGSVLPDAAASSPDGAGKTGSGAAPPEPHPPASGSDPAPPKGQSDRVFSQIDMLASQTGAKAAVPGLDAGTPTITMDSARSANLAGSAAPQGTPTTAGSMPVREAVPIERLVFEIVASARERVREIEVRLDPPELGRIDVTLDVDELGKVTTRLVVEKAETLDQLRRDAPALERALNDAGLKTDSGSLQFSLRDGQHDRRDDPERRSKRGHVALPTDEINAWRPIDASARAARGGIDVRI
jgi:flagellar hook-length control protein FliK